MVSLRPSVPCTHVQRPLTMECGGEGPFGGGLAPWRTLGLAHALPVEGGHFHALEDITSAFVGPTSLQPTDSEAFSAVAHGEEQTWK